MMSDPTQVPSEVDPKVQELMTALLNKTVELVMKLAICKCDRRDNCKVYETSREIAIVVDKLQALRPARITIGRGMGRRRRTKPTGVT